LAVAENLGMKLHAHFIGGRYTNVTGQQAIQRIAESLRRNPGAGNKICCLTPGMDTAVCPAGSDHTNLFSGELFQRFLQLLLHGDWHFSASAILQ
jgi:hypothetical protein